MQRNLLIRSPIERRTSLIETWLCYPFKGTPVLLSLSLSLSLSSLSLSLSLSLSASLFLPHSNQTVLKEEARGTYPKLARYPLEKLGWSRFVWSQSTCPLSQGRYNPHRHIEHKTPSGTDALASPLFFLPLFSVGRYEGTLSLRDRGFLSKCTALDGSQRVAVLWIDTIQFLATNWHKFCNFANWQAIKNEALAVSPLCPID